MSYLSNTISKQFPNEIWHFESECPGAACAAHDSLTGKPTLNRIAFPVGELGRSLRMSAISLTTHIVGRKSKAPFARAHIAWLNRAEKIR